MIELLDEKQQERCWSMEAEAGVLGSMIIERDCIGSILGIVQADDFYSPENQIIFTALMELYMGGAPTDPVALRTQLKKMNQLERIGGVEYIARILDSVPSAVNAQYYAGVVRDRRQYRDIHKAIERMREVLDEPGTVAEQAQAVQDIALSIDADKAETEFFSLTDYATKVVGDMGNKTDTIPTGFRNIDRIIGGVCPGELVILAARPSVGKSALALDIALKMAKQGKSIVFFSLEMGHGALIERAACSLAHVNGAALKAGRDSQEDLEKVCAAAFELRELNIVFHEGGTTPERQRGFIEARRKSHGVDIVFVDYLQLMNAGRRNENRVQEISEISRKLKLSAMREQVPVIALSQLNRQVETRQTHRPRLSDLRDSGSIEQDADIVILLHREDYYRRSEKPDAGGGDMDGQAGAIVAKNRRGPTGIAGLVFLEEYASFGDLIDGAKP
ncbi:MAG TPA: replicative DNA helicase [Sedimentisphaerales bacterium]|nr:replicative DNA helicase [Sedimentisphaerales bacterium]